MTTIEVIEAAQARGGFLLGHELEFLAEHDRLRPVLVRCGGCRFTCPAQDVNHLWTIIAASETEYVRDISLPASTYPCGRCGRQSPQDNAATNACPECAPR